MGQSGPAIQRFFRAYISKQVISTKGQFKALKLEPASSGTYQSFESFLTLFGVDF